MTSRDMTHSHSLTFPGEPNKGVGFLCFHFEKRKGWQKSSGILTSCKADRRLCLGGAKSCLSVVHSPNGIPFCSRLTFASSLTSSIVSSTRNGRKPGKSDQVQRSAGGKCGQLQVPKGRGWNEGGDSRLLKIDLAPHSSGTFQNTRLMRSRAV